MADDPIVGHKIMMNGTTQPLRESEADAIWEAIEADEKRRLVDMPTSRSALSAMCSARTRLKDLGWRDGIYCPKDGSAFAVCEVGSTGMWKGFYQGKWPDGHIICADCANRPEGMFWKPIADLTEEEAAHVAKCEDDMRTMIEAYCHSFGSYQKESSHD